MPKREFSENIIVKNIPCLGRLHFVRDPEGYMALSFTTFYWIYGSFVNLFIILLPHYNDNQCPPELVLCRFSLQSEQNIFYFTLLVNTRDSSVVDHQFELQSDQTKNYKISICCFSAKAQALRNNRKDCITQTKYNVTEKSYMSTCRLVSVSQLYEISTKRIGLVQSRHHHHLHKNTLFLP